MESDFDRDAEGTPVFVIGLTMAGAISAGAYTAGVVDYLMRAMHAHNKRVGTPGGPKHKVMVKAISGASAGGICAGLIATNLLAVGRNGAPDWDTPQPLPYPGGETKLVLDRIYKAWVQDIKMWDEGSKTGLLAMEDLDDADRKTLDQEAAGLVAAGAISALNGHHLDDVAKAAVGGIPAWTASDAGYDFLSSELELFLTTTAINPTVYEVTFGGNAPFKMSQHGIVRHFCVEGLGSGPQLPSPWLVSWRDTGIRLNPRNAPSPLPLDSANGGGWTKLTVSSLATGAFPMALAPRVIDTTPWEMGGLGGPDRTSQGGALPYDLDARYTARPYFGLNAVETRAPYVALDGGAVDNEPFAYARYAIRKGGPDASGALQLDPNPRTAKEAHRAVLMVDPFPEGDTFSVLDPPRLLKMLGIAAVGKRLQKTLVGQARFKPAELLQAQDPEVHSRFMITPRRGSDGRTDGIGAGAISCGLLGGFGGFLDESFRKHDFVLGQRNCQWFLKRHFVLDPENAVLGMSGSSATEPVRIIDPGPDSDLTPEIHLHEWPQMAGAGFDAMVAQLDTRLKKLGKVEIDKLSSKGAMGFVLKTAWSNFTGLSLRSMLVDTANRAMMADLILRNQHADYAAYSDAERVLLVGLIRQGDTPISAADLESYVLNAQSSEELDAQLPQVELPKPPDIEFFLKRQEKKTPVTRSLKSMFSTPKFYFKV